ARRNSGRQVRCCLLTCPSEVTRTCAFPRVAPLDTPMLMLGFLRSPLWGIAAFSLAFSAACPSAAQESRSRLPLLLTACPAAPRADALPELCVPPSWSEEQARPAATIVLQVPEGTPLRIALDERTRISRPGTAIHGRVVEAVYAFDQVVIPPGSEVTGQVTEVLPVSGMHRTMSYANGDFTPFHAFHVTFETLTLP